MKGICYTIIGWGMIITVILSPFGIILLCLNDIRNNTEK